MSRIINSPTELPYVPVPDTEREYVIKKILKLDQSTMADVKEDREALARKRMLELFQDVVLDSSTPVSSRTNLSFGKSRQTLFEILEKARGKKYINQISIKATRGPGQKGFYLELTQAGMDLLVENDLWKEGKPYYRGKMGFVGSLLLHGLLIPHFEDMGLQVLVEGINKGNDCDLGVLGTEESLDIAVELSVHTSAKQELVNIMRDLKTGWKEVICVVIALECRDNLKVENEQKTVEKITTFKRYFKEYLLEEEYAKVTVANIKDFRVKRRKK